MARNSVIAASDSTNFYSRQTRRSLPSLTVDVIRHTLVMPTTPVALITMILLAMVSGSSFAQELSGVKADPNIESATSDVSDFPSVKFASLVSVDRKPTKFLTGRRIDVANRSAKSVTWTSGDLRSRLARFSQSQKLGLFLDRRADPFSQTEVFVRDATTESLLWEIAKLNNIGICRLGNVYYFGPTDSAAVLPSLMAQLKQETSKRKKSSVVRWHGTSALKTDDIVEPRLLLENLAKDNQFKISGLDEIPHDVWRGFELPPLTLAEQVQLLLVGFGKTFRRNADGTEVTLVDIEFPDRVSHEVPFAENLSSANYESVMAQLKSRYTSLSAKRKGKKAFVEGPVDEVLGFQAAMVGLQKADKSKPTARTKDVYTLNVTASRLSILNNVAQQDGLKLAVLAQHKSLLDERIDVAVDSVSLPELLAAVLKGSGLQASVSGGRLDVSDQLP